MNSQELLEQFHPAVRTWFVQTFGEPSPPQLKGWPAISSGKHTLILAPTGSGKTLAAFLWGINHVLEQSLREDLSTGVRILYISPLKALNNDIHRNLEEPLDGILHQATRMGLTVPRISSAVRTGDTPQSKRSAMLRHPPDILITTPESLYIMLTSKQARKMFRTVQYVIVDEIHSICNNKRGVHLSLSLERLSALAEQEYQRIGLSATQRPLELIARFLGGQSWSRKELSEREVTIVNAGRKKQMDLAVLCPVADFSNLPQASVWPAIFEILLAMIREHTTSLIFVNNRRLAERVAAKLNEIILSGNDGPAVSGKHFGLYAVPSSTKLDEPPTTSIPPEELVQAYHGSMSRQAREQMESDLKAGKLRALVATSSLELGIDIGSIDLVVQLQSPKGVARGLQRVGRSGHLVSATSKGRIIPSHKEDLVESAVVAQAMADHEVEMTSIPTNCLDVLAQQIVAMVSVDDWLVDDLYDLIRQSYCYQNLSRNLFMQVIKMLSGRYEHESFRDLRARISWDKVNNILRALPGSSHIAITSGGTIADRGYLRVYLPDGKTKVGEVDEEFIYESRTGDTFILGTNVWRMIEIDSNKVTVEPAPGQPARMPFWRGEGIGRTFELGEKVARFRREVAERLDDHGILRWLQARYPMNSDAAWNIVEYFRKQREFTSEIPHEKLLILEGFRDELGDPRIVLHSSFGRRVNGLFGLVLARRLHHVTGVEPQMLYNDDGILLRSTDVDEMPLSLLDNISVAEAESIVLDEVMMSPLFGAQFRVNAARALLLTKAYPGKRTPLWLQRLRAGDLLQVVRQFDDFPIVIETIREVLHDTLDFPHFKEIVAALESGAIELRTVRTEIPSPFAASLLFDFISVYMYEWDQPKADQMSQFLSVNRELLGQVVDLETMKSLLKPEAVDEVEEQLQRKTNGYKARSAEELLELLLRLGDLSDEEIVQRSATASLDLLQPLVEDGRAASITFAGAQRWIAGEERDLYDRLAEDKARAVVLSRYVRAHGVVRTEDLSNRYNINSSKVTSILSALEQQGELCRGFFLPESAAMSKEQQWSFRPNIERIHRQSLAILRKEITPSSMTQFTAFLQAWQHLSPDTQLNGSDGLGEGLTQLQGLPLPAETWERDVLPPRIKDYPSIGLVQHSGHSEFVWMGAGSGKLAQFHRGAGAAFLPQDASDSEERMSTPAKLVLEYLRRHGASFLSDIRSGTDLPLRALNNGIAQLFWGGIITNDLFEEVINVKRLPRASDEDISSRIQLLTPGHNPTRSQAMKRVRRALQQAPGWKGRWFVVRTPAVLGPSLTAEEQALHQARQLLDRYGIVARELSRREGLVPWPAISSVLQRMELQGKLRRGYFVEGLSGMQYALPRAVEELRRLKSLPTTKMSRPILLNACDPANPYGPGIDLSPDTAFPDGFRLTRAPWNHIIFKDGSPCMFLENFGARIWTLEPAETAFIKMLVEVLSGWIGLPERIRPVRQVSIEYWNGERPAQTALAPAFKNAGFRRERNQTMCFDGYR